MSDPDVTPDPARGGGHALIRVPGAAAAIADPRFRLTRDGFDAGTLGPRGWQVADALLAPLAAHAEGADLVLSIGPAVVDTVESGVVTLGVPAAQRDEPVFWPELPLSRGGAGSVGLAMPTAAAAAVVTPPPLQGLRPVTPERAKPENLTVARPRSMPPKTPSTPPVIVPAKNSILPFVLVGLLVLAAAGGGAWYYLHKPTEVAISTPPAPHPPTPTPPTPTPPTLTPPTPTPPTLTPATPTPPTPTPAARDCTKGSVAEMVACAPDPAALAKVAQQKWDAGQADQGLVLMQIAADRGSGAAALKLAQLYDPAAPRPGGPQAGPGLQPNAREAAQYYRRAAQAHEDAAAAPREALRQRLQRDADNGDAMAPLTLKDFWP